MLSTPVSLIDCRAAAGAQARSDWPRWMVKALATLLAAGCVVVSPNPRAQSAPNEYPVAPSGSATQSDPPARVGRISLISGPVSLTDLQGNDTEAATLNWPITSAHRLSTGRLGRAEVRIGSIAVRLDDDTDVDFNRIDDELVQIVVQRGSVALRLRSRDLLREIDLVTPRERIAFDDVGRYRIDVDRSAGITAVTAFVGHARVTSGRSTFAVHSGQRGEITSAPGLGFQLVGASPDVFDDWVASRDRRDDSSRSAQYVSRETTGIESLDDHGSWSSAAEYGPVWYPAYVPSGWAPYRHGRWVWMSPWGWTWIDEAPWGFAPFHYGRWVIVGGRWCWAPGRWIARPYYAPALVAWYGRPGVSISISAGYPVGWFPLGWGDVYYPPHHHSPRYIRSVNIQNVTHINNITVINPPVNYAHQRHPDSVSWAPARSLPRRDRIQDVMSGRPPEELVRAAPVAKSPVVVDNEFRKRTLPAVVDAGDLTRPTPRSGARDIGAPPTIQQPPAVTPGSDRVRVQPPRTGGDGQPGPKRSEPTVTQPEPGVRPPADAVPRAQPVPRSFDPTPQPRAIEPPQPPRPPKVNLPPAGTVEPIAPPRAPRVDRPAPPQGERAGPAPRERSPSEIEAQRQKDARQDDANRGEPRGKPGNKERER